MLVSLGKKCSFGLEQFVYVVHTGRDAIVVASASDECGVKRWAAVPLPPAETLSANGDFSGPLAEVRQEPDAIGSAAIAAVVTIADGGAAGIRPTVDNSSHDRAAPTKADVVGFVGIATRWRFDGFVSLANAWAARFTGDGMCMMDGTLLTTSEMTEMRPPLLLVTPSAGMV